jgi:hypothetical protein
MFIFIVGNSYGQNRLNSRLFYLKPPLYNSKSKIEDFAVVSSVITVLEPIDNRNQFYGEVVYKNKKVQKLEEFFQLPTMIEIQNKIISDLSSYGVDISRDSTNTGIVIKTIVEVFYPDVRGFIWGKSFAKVRLKMIAKSGDIELINKKYESFYITNGTDKEFEGSMLMTIEQGANVTIGMALRKVLDEFYDDFKEKI